MSQQASQEIKYIKSLNVAHLNARNSQATNFEMLRNLTEVSKKYFLCKENLEKTQKELNDLQSTFKENSEKTVIIFLLLSLNNIK